ncbi:hypothetical protein KC19_5G077900 [Ceratodon purpureus]|uniref:Uncharacterized protein n=1 Tax=Ceratodon purpureus TaxID=3225 RepID=A0A8T0I0H9_CERPU|nr:hypothetical protein KC19_5G077900 [Ceratodon purpureus]KAG0576411.1 hypothetical protein KC19_5G077900 [Ceratodon purpureus]KAG0576414.1 hypothetical protein KC19_5G077900 [Ceratodon purpureus]KAG0576415.1 hypothetical protein KC19_5G077900 [Ceratodon purpureus]
MGARCSKAPDKEQVSDEDDHPRDSPSLRPWRSFNATNGPSSELNFQGAKKRMGWGKGKNQEVTDGKQGGWGLKFALDVRTPPLSPGEQGAHSNGSEKKKLARALSDKATSVRSKTTTVAKKGASKVSEVLRGAGTVGLGALDTFSTSVANLNTRGGFAAVAVSKGSKIGILAFEVANTIVKGCNLKHSLGAEDMKTLKEEILVSEGVQRLVSTNLDELMAIAAADKRNELKVFTDEVVRFGNHCRDPQWHCYDRVFQRLVKEIEIPKVPNKEADEVMDNLMTLAQNTADLYHELHSLDRFRTDLKRKQQEEESAGAAARGGETVALLRSEVKSQEKHVEALKKRSLWSRTLEEVMEQLVDVANFLYQEIHDNFGPNVFLEEPAEEAKRNAGKLGAAGLALHYANIINQIDSLVIRPGSVPPNTRDNLYQGLPPKVKAGLRARLQQHAHGDGSIDEIKAEMYKILNWLVPVASNTTKAHHGFGWVGEWANTGSPADRRAMGYVEITLVQTLHHANQQKVEGYMLELIIGLHHLVSRAKNNAQNNTKASLTNGDRSPQKSPARILVKPSHHQQTFILSDRSVSPPPFGMFSSVDFTQEPDSHLSKPPGPISLLSQVDKDMLHKIGSEMANQRKIIPGLSRSQEFDNSRAKQELIQLKLSKSSSHSQSSANSELEAPLYRPRNRITPLRFNIHHLDARDGGGGGDGAQSGP